MRAFVSFTPICTELSFGLFAAASLFRLVSYPLVFIHLSCAILLIPAASLSQVRGERRRDRWMSLMNMCCGGRKENNARYSYYCRL